MAMAAATTTTIAWSMRSCSGRVCATPAVLSARLLSSEAAELRQSVAPDAASVTAAVRGAVARLALRQRNQNVARDAECVAPTTNGSIPAPLERFIAEDMLQGVKGKRVRGTMAVSALAMPRKGPMNRAEVDAYVASALAGEYAVVNRIASELRARFPHFAPKKIFELCHTSSAIGVLAALPVFLHGANSDNFYETEDGAADDDDDGVVERRRKREKAIDITAVCDSPAMRDVATRLMHATDVDGVEFARVRGGRGAGRSNVTWLRQMPAPSMRQDRFDLVISAFALSKMDADGRDDNDDGDGDATITRVRGGDSARARPATRPSRRRRHLMDMWELVGEGGMLVLVEDGSNEGSAIVQEARRVLVDEERARLTHNTARGADSPPLPFHVAGPCPHEMQCPRLAASGGKKKAGRCFFRQRIEPPRYRRSILGSKGKGFEDVYYSYLVLYRRPRSRMSSVASPAAGGVDLNDDDGHVFEIDADELFAPTHVDDEDTGDGEDEDAHHVVALAAMNTRTDQSDSAAASGDGGSEHFLDDGNRPAAASALVDDDDNASDTEGECEANGAFDVDGYFSSLVRESANSRWSRIVQSASKEKKGTVRLHICTPHGDLRRLTYTKHRSRRAAPGPDGYRLARRVKWGDLWPFRSAAVTDILNQATAPAARSSL